MIRVLCVDDNLDLAEMLDASIRAEPDMESAGILTSADALFEEVAARRPDVVLVDLSMPGRSPLEAIAEVSEKQPQSRVVVVSGYDDPDTVGEAIECGASGFVSKHGDVQRLLQAIRSVARGEVVVDYA